MHDAYIFNEVQSMLHNINMIFYHSNNLVLLAFVCFLEIDNLEIYGENLNITTAISELLFLLPYPKSSQLTQDS